MTSNFLTQNGFGWKNNKGTATLWQLYNDSNNFSRKLLSETEKIMELFERSGCLYVQDKKVFAENNGYTEEFRNIPQTVVEQVNIRIRDNEPDEGIRNSAYGVVGLNWGNVRKYATENMIEEEKENYIPGYVLHKMFNQNEIEEKVTNAVIKDIENKALLIENLTDEKAGQWIEEMVAYCKQPIDPAARDKRSV